MIRGIGAENSGGLAHLLNTLDTALIPDHGIKAPESYAYARFRGSAESHGKRMTNVIQTISCAEAAFGCRCYKSKS